MTKQLDRERKEWKKLLKKSQKVIMPLDTGYGEIQERDKDLKLLDLYLRKRNDDALYWHNFWMVILTSVIVLLTATNIWLSYYK